MTAEPTSVRDLTTRYARQWQGTLPEFTRHRERFSCTDRCKNEARLDHFLGEALRRAEETIASDQERHVLMERTQASVRAFVLDLFGGQTRQDAEKILSAFSTAGDEFVRRARAFDPHIAVEDIHQALRNLWILNSLQVCFDRDVAVTPSGFAYSMLYPITDNYLDDPAVRKERKTEFVRLFARRLAGESYVPDNEYEQTLSRLIDMIESEYPRSQFPQVYQSLLSINSAQMRSLSQQAGALDPQEILDVTLEKGGTSVLADAYLAAGRLSAEDVDFSFGYGVFLQMIDDLQDLAEDIEKGHTTVFVRASQTAPLDMISNRLLMFQLQVVSRCDRLTSPKGCVLRELIEKGCFMLIVEAVARNSRHFSDAYVTMLEEFSPLRIEFMRGLKKRINKHFVKIKRIGMVYAKSSSAHGHADILRQLDINTSTA